MKTSEYPETDERTVPFPPAEKETAIVTKTPDPAPPRYIDAPIDPAQRAASRNLAIGITCIVIAAFALWLGLYYAGATAARTLVTAVGACGLGILFAQRRVLTQKNGILLALGVAALFGAAVPWVEGSFRKLDSIAREQLGEPAETIVRTSTPPPPPNAETAPPAPPTIALPDTEEPEQQPAAFKKPVLVMKAPKKQEPASAVLAAEDKGLARELIVPEPTAESGRIVRLLKDMEVELDGRPSFIRAGTLAPMKSLADGKVVVLAGDHEISMDVEFVKFTAAGASKESPEELTRLAQREAVLRYPKLGEADSKENLLFLTRKKELELEPDGKSFFQNPRWPFLLAEQLATQENWVPFDPEAAAKSGEAVVLPPGKEPIPDEISPERMREIEKRLNEDPGNVPPANEAPANELPPELPPLDNADQQPVTPQENVPPPVKPVKPVQVKKK